MSTKKPHLWETTIQYVVFKTELFPKPLRGSPIFFFNSDSGQEVEKVVNTDCIESGN